MFTFKVKEIKDTRSEDDTETSVVLISHRLGMCVTVLLKTYGFIKCYSVL